MGIIKDTSEVISESVDKVRKLPNFVIILLSSLIMISLYWFIGIFLFHHDFFIKNPFWITIIFSVGLSFIWYLINFFISSIQIEKLYNDSDTDSVFFVGGFISIIYLTLVIAVLYFLKPCVEITIKTFIIVSFSYIGLQLLRTLILLLLPKKNN